jgi:hypothetical protein
MRVLRHGTYAVGVGGKVYIPGGGVVQGGDPVEISVFMCRVRDNDGRSDGLMLDRTN